MDSTHIPDPDAEAPEAGASDTIEAHLGAGATNVVIGRNNVQNINQYTYFAPQHLVPLQKPARTPHFIGRQKALAQLIGWLQPGRIVTLCGAGGIGKTALAAEAVWTLSPGEQAPAQFPDGIVFHPFYHQPQAELALEAIARVFGEDPRPSARDAARRALASKRALVVLDGVEEADDLEAVLGVTGTCGVLMTSRRRQDAPDAWQDLRPLPLAESVALLRACAGGLAADYGAVRQVARLLGGLPLALFLAGRFMVQQQQSAAAYLTWLNQMGLEALHLGQRQHRSIVLLMEHSLVGLSQPARLAFGVAGVLALAPFDAELVAVALAVTRTAAVRALSELIDYGLLIPIGGNYQVTHRLAYNYARGVTAAAVSLQLASYFVTLVEEQSALGPAGYARLDGLRAHLVAVQATLLKAAAWELVCRLAWAMNGYLEMQGRMAERFDSLAAGLEAARQAQNREAEAAFCSLLGTAYMGSGQMVQALRCHTEALAISRTTGDEEHAGAYLAGVGSVHYAAGRLETALPYFAQALAISRRRGDQHNEASHLGSLGNIWLDLGRVETAIWQHSQALAISRAIGDQRGVANHLGNLGLAYAALGRVAEAASYYQQALTTSRAAGDRHSELHALGNLGTAEGALGWMAAAIEHHEQALILSRTLGDRRSESSALAGLGLIYLSLEHTDIANQHFVAGLALSRAIGDRRGEGVHLGNLGNRLRALGRNDEAIDFLQEALAISRELRDRRGEAIRAWNLGVTFAAAGDWAQAAAFMQVTVDYEVAIGHPAAADDAAYLEAVKRQRQQA